MAFSLSLSPLFARETCLASGISEDGSACTLKGRHQFSVFQRVAEKQIVRLSLKGDDLASLEDDSAKSINLSRQSKLHREKPSYHRETNFSAETPRKHSSSAEREETEDVGSKVASSKFESTLQDIFNEFKSSDRRSVLQRKKASGRSVSHSGKDSRTARLKQPRNDCRNLSGQASLDALEDRAVSEESDLGFDNSSTGVASGSVRETASTTARRQRFSSGFKSNIPIGQNGIDISSQNENVLPQRSSSSNGWRSSQSSMIKRSSKDLWMSDSKDGASTAISVSDPSSKQLGSLLKSKERMEAHNSPELDIGNETHESDYDFHTASLASRSSSSASSQELRTQISPQFMDTSTFEPCSDSGVEYMEGFGHMALSDSVVEDDVENGSHTSPVSRGEISVSNVSEQGTANSDVEDDVVGGSPKSTSGVGPNSMSLPELSTFLCEERVFDSPSSLGSIPDNDTVPLNDNEANTLNTSRDVTKKGSFSSVPASAIRFDHDPNAKSTLGVDGGGACDFSPSGLAVSQDTVKKQPAWDHPLSDLPFELQYSYSETPNERIIGFRRGSHFSPFGPATRGRPWTGSAPFNPSKKKLPEFDSFKPPPKGKKGIKPVQDPGPYSEGQGPQTAYSREEIIGKPLSKEEVVELVEKSASDKRQVHLGRDGLTHNMLVVIHAHWKRRRVCKIKCLGVPTVDMDNVCFHVEEKTGGKIIYRNGGVLYLFRGRNYNYRDRPRIPLMLWKPATPIYPRLIEKAPGGLTEEQADQLRTIGKNVVPLCKLGKNGVYLNLVNDVRTAFKVDDLVRIDCQGLNPSDYKKIGAKLKDLVPCVLLSFEKEHILMWKGRDVNASSLVDTNPGYMLAGVKDKLNFLQEPTSLDGRCLDLRNSNTKTNFQLSETQTSNSLSVSSQAPEEGIPSSSQEVQAVSQLDHCHSAAEDTIPITTNDLLVSKFPQRVKDAFFKETSKEAIGCPVEAIGSAQVFLDKENLDKVDILPEHSVLFESLPQKRNDSMEFNSTREEEEEENALSDIELKNEDQFETCHAGVDDLWQQAFESGIAIELDEADLDMDSVLEKSDKLAHEAPPGPVYTRSLTKKSQLRVKKIRSDEVTQINFGKIGLMKKKKAVKRVAGLSKEKVPQSDGIPVNELARLLA